MSEKKAKTYTAELKESAVKLAVESDKPATETARELGVNVNTLHTWIAKYHRPKAASKASEERRAYIRRTQAFTQRELKTERRESHIKECH